MNFGKKIMEFLTTKALYNSWRQYHYMNHLRIQNATIHCEDINQSILFWKSFKHFFKSTVEPKEFIKATEKVWYNYKHYQAHTKEYNYEVFKKYLKVIPNKKYELVYSIIDETDPNVTAFGKRKGLLPEVKSILTKNIKGIDLGNSRGFSSVDEIIEKTEILASSKVYIGSACSWARMCPLFDTRCVFVQDHAIVK